MRLTWHDYHYLPYESVLASREVAALLGHPLARKTPHGIDVIGEPRATHVGRLTYFASAVKRDGSFETIQNSLERSARTGRRRQATRYSVHGLHEYKGKFNPQIAKALLNIFGIKRGARVLDPFCGSGTTLVECAHVRARGLGIDLNPFAVFLANAKMLAMVTPASKLRAILSKMAKELHGRTSRSVEMDDNPRERYLQSWFDADVVRTIEAVRLVINKNAGRAAPIFLALASDLLRDYSLQDPRDLRIRRRKSPIPTLPFTEAWVDNCRRSIGRLEAAQNVVGHKLPLGRAIQHDVTTVTPTDVKSSFDAAITSPPYAMALPYLDTQRLSLVWLSILAPPDVARLEGELIGSRELRGSVRKRLVHAMIHNEADVPEAQVELCHKLQIAIGECDGFRRRAVPVLLYRYFAMMLRSFRAIRTLVRTGAPFAMVVGGNHTTLGGQRKDIDTARHLTEIAARAGWIVEEKLPLQTYQRYGYHVRNAVRSETLVILRKP